MEDDTLNLKQNGSGGPFLMVPSRLASDPRHRDRMGDAVWLYLYLLAVARASGSDEVVTKRTILAKRLEICVRSVTRHLGLLDDAGYITRRSTGHAVRIVILPLSGPVRVGEG